MPNTPKEKEYWDAQKHGSEKPPEDLEVTHEEPHEDDAVERGERLDTGKTIHRGGKTEGAVPGTDEKSADKENKKRKENKKQ